MSEAIHDTGRMMKVPDFSEPTRMMRVTVKPGETLQSIAQSLRMSFQDLQAANPQIADPSNLRPGMELFLPQRSGAGQLSPAALPSAQFERTQATLFQSIQQAAVPSVPGMALNLPGLSLAIGETLAPSASGCPSLEQSGWSIQQTLAGVMGSLDGAATGRLEAAINALVSGARTAGPVPLYLEGLPPENALLTPESALRILDATLQQVFGQIAQQPAARDRTLTPFELSIGAAPERLQISQATIGAAAKDLIASFTGPDNIYGEAPFEPTLRGCPGLDPQALLDLAAIERQVESLLQELLTGLKSLGPMPAPVAASAPKPAAPSAGKVAEGASGVRESKPDELRRAELDKSHSDDDLNKLSADPKMMAAATPEQKSKMIKQLMDGWTTDQDDEGIYNVLKSARSKEEFDQICQLAGNKDIFNEIDHDPTKKRMNILAGAWGRPELATNAEEAKLAEGELLKGESELCEMSDPAAVDPKYGRMPEAGADAGERFESLVDSRTKARAYGDLDPGARADLVAENAMRRADGKQPLDLTSLTAALETIREDTSLSKDDREKKIEEVRKRFDLSEDTMRQLGTRRMGQVYAESGAEGEAIAKVMMEQLQQKHSQAVLIYGPDSAQAAQLETEIQKLEKVAGPYAKRLQEVGGQLQELYPVPKSFWENVVGFFGKIMDWFTPLLNYIPGVGTLVYAGYTAYKAGSALASGDVGKFFKDMAGGVLGGGSALAYGKLSLDAADPLTSPAMLMYSKMQGEGAVDAVRTGDPVALASLAANALGPIGGAVGGVAGTVLTTAGQLAQAGVGVAKGVDAARRGDILGAITGFGGGALGGAAALGLDPKMLDTVNRAFKIASSGAQFGVGVAKNDWDNILGGIGGLAGGIKGLGVPGLAGGDGIGDKALKLIQDGSAFALGLKNGNFGGALGKLGDVLSDTGIDQWGKSVMDNPVVRDIADITQRGIGVVENITNGKYASAIQGLADGLGAFGGSSMKDLLENPVVKNVLDYSTQGAQFYQNLRDGKYVDALGLLDKNLGPFFQGSALGKGMDAFRGLAGATEAAINHDYGALQQYLTQGASGARSLLDSLGGGSFTSAFGDLAGQAQRIIQDPGVRSAYDLVSGAAPFVQSLIGGDYARAVERALQIPGLTSLRPALNGALDSAREAGPFLTAIAGGDYVRGLSALCGPQGLFAGNEVVRSALSEVQQATSFFGNIARGGFDLDGSRGLMGMLERVASFQEILPELRKWEMSVQDLMMQQGGNVDALARSLWQSSSDATMSPGVVLY